MDMPHANPRPPRPVGAPQQPTDPFLTAYMIVLTVLGFCIGGFIRSMHRKDVALVLRDMGVRLKKVARTAREIERKMFHLAGLLVPLIYQLMIQQGFDQTTCQRICWSITIPGVILDMARIHIPFVADNWPLKSILREKEKTQLCGGVYFSLGCTLAIHFFAPAIAITSIIFLVLGDMSAALIGISFGHDMCVVKLGREGKKSLEGSVAMFFVCFIIGCTVFSQVHLREYAVFIGSMVATLTELHEPLGINDNLSIPVATSLALTLGFERTFPCEAGASTHNPLNWFETHGWSLI